MKSVLLGLSLLLMANTLSSQIINTQRIAQADDAWKEDAHKGIEQLVQLRRMSPFYFTADSTVAIFLERNGLPDLLEELDSVYRQEVQLLKQWYFEKVLEEAYWNQGYRYVDAQLEFDKLNFYPQVYRVLLNPAGGAMGLDRRTERLLQYTERLTTVEKIVALWSKEEREIVEAWSNDWAILTKKLRPRLLEGTPSEEQREQQGLFNTLLLWSRFRTK